MAASPLQQLDKFRPQDGMSRDGWGNVPKAGAGAGGGKMALGNARHKSFWIASPTFGMSHHCVGGYGEANFNGL